MTSTDVHETRDRQAHSDPAGSSAAGADGLLADNRSEDEKQAYLIDLLARVALKDEMAFRDLYEATSGALFGFARRVVNDDSIASEVLQEAYIKIWNRAEGYRPHLAKPMTWLITIVRNHGIDTLRKQRIKIDDTPIDEMIDIVDEDNESPLQSSIHVDEQRQLTQCLDTLSEDQKRAVLLSFYQGLSHDEIATKMNSPLGTVKSWVRRGLTRLKDCLNQNENT